MALFEPAFKIVLDREGGFADKKNDKGGATKFGISLRFLRDCGIDVDDLDRDGITMEKCGDLNNDGVVDAKDIRLLTVEMAKRLYFKYFWQRIKADVLLDQRIATIAFDMAVNSGNDRAIRYLQMTANQMNAKQIEIDGVAGPDTMRAVNTTVDATKFCLALLQNRKAFYLSLVRSDASQEVFLKGWMNRLELLRKDLCL